MNNKERIIEILHSLGFRPEQIGDDSGYSIEYEGVSIVYSVEDDDSGSLTFIVPGLVKVDDDNRDRVVRAIFSLLEGLKYVQPAIVFGDSVWISYQHYIGSHEPELETVEHMIRVLAVATERFHNLLDGNDE